MSDVDGDSLPASTGRGGGLFQRTDNFRSDANMLAQMLSLGVVEIEEVQEVLRQAFVLAKSAASDKKYREYSAMLGAILAAAKLAQDERKLATPKKVVNNLNVNVGSPERRADSLEARLIAEAQRRGLTADGIVSGDGSGSGDD